MTAELSETYVGSGQRGVSVRAGRGGGGDI